MTEAIRREIGEDLQAALRDVETMLAERNAEFADISEQFSQLVQALVRLRNHVTEAERSEKTAAGLPPLEQINAMISVAASIEYPRAGICWPRIESVHRHLQEMVSSHHLH